MPVAARRRRAGERWRFPFPRAQAEEVLKRLCQVGACAASLLDRAGQPILTMASDACAPQQCDHVEGRTPLVIGGTQRGSLVAVMHLRSQQLEVLQRVQLAAAWLADVWGVAGELDSLAGEVVQAYEELHLLYLMGEELTGHMGIAETAEFIVNKTRPTFDALRAELRLHDAELAFVSLRSAQLGAGQTKAEAAEGRVLTAPVRAGGGTIGTLEVHRGAEDEPFTSRHGKLLDAIGSLAGSAIRNAQLYEEAHQRVYLSTLLDNVAEGIITIGDGGVVSSVNRAVERLLVFKAGELQGQPLRTLFATPHDERIDEHLVRWSRESTLGSWGEMLGIRADGEMIPLDVVASEMQLGTQRRLIVSLRDARERKQAEAALRHQALHDALTNLPNRALLNDRLEQALQVGQRFNTPLALLVMDLDSFKDVNDTFGHQYGDRLLYAVARRLARLIDSADSVARTGGDEFAVLLPTADERAARGVAERLLRAFGQPFEVDGHSLHVGLSIGMARYPVDGADAETLLRRADVAMYAAKRNGSGLALYDPEQDDSSPLRLALLSELRHAFERDELVMYYQPKVSLRGDQRPCAEALVRWQHPTHGLLGPGYFVPLAERTALVKPLGEWVLNAVIRQCRTWRDRGMDLKVAVNLSARHLHDLHLPSGIAELLRTWDVPSSSLMVEITENSLMVDHKRALQVLRSLRDMGVGVSVDDFGTGYSSLAYLKQLPVSELKIDRSFIKDVATDENDAAIVRSTVSLGHDLGLSVVAEGVEDGASLKRLEALGCDMVQGYYIARPMPAADLERWLDQTARPTPFVAVA